MTVIEAANGMAGHATALGIAEAIARKNGGWGAFYELSADRFDFRAAHTALLLESDEADRVVLDKVGNLSMRHTVFLMSLGSPVKRNEPMPVEEYRERIEAMGVLAVEVVNFARERLATLDKPG